MLTSTGKVEYKLQVILFTTAVSLLCAAAPAPHKSPSAVDSSYRQSFEQWKAGLLEDRKQEWLPLAGLFWLKAGDNTFGTDPKNSIVFPKGPAQAGSFSLDGTTTFCAPARNIMRIPSATPVRKRSLSDSPRV